MAMAACLCFAAAACGPVDRPMSAGDFTPAVQVAANVADATLAPSSAISPTADTIIDDKAVLLLADGADLARISVNGLLAAKLLVPGSPKALALAGYLRTVRDSLKLALDAQQGLQARSYNEAVERGMRALALAKGIAASVGSGGK